MTSKNLPVPAEHLSFITKSSTFPFCSTITLISCPPMSITVTFPSAKKAAPRPRQVISVTVLSKN